MAQKRKGTAIRIPKKKSPAAQQSKRSGGEVAIVACTCAIKLEAADPIESVSGGGVDASFFRPAYSLEPACTGHQDCTMVVGYRWVLPMRPPPKLVDRCLSLMGSRMSGLSASRTRVRSNCMSKSG